eukprot:2464723-Rhodomonas_salina.1
MAWAVLSSTSSSALSAQSSLSRMSQMAQFARKHNQAVSPMSRTRNVTKTYQDWMAEKTEADVKKW